ncbi:MAG: multiheme c-type cytochrome [Planctomycetota bacterium]
MAAAIKEARAKSPNVAAIDAGDTLISADAKRRGAMTGQTVKKSELMADFLKVARPEAVALGDLDFLVGPAAASVLFETRGFVPIATNVRFADPAVKTVPYIAWEIAGYRFVAVNLFGPRAVTGIEGASVTEPIAALDAALAAAGKVDVLLACCHRFDDALMKRLAETDGPPRIVIDGDGMFRVRGASSVSRTILTKPPARGTEFMTAELYLKRDAPNWYKMDRYEAAVRAGTRLEEEAMAAAKCSLVEFKSRRLSSSQLGDPEVLKRIEEYKAWSRGAALAAAPDDPKAPQYVGAEACGACHKEQLANWKSTIHSHAWDSLVADPDGGAQDPECVSCHVSGFLQPGGTRRIEDTAPFRGVQCESCHTPVAKHPGGAKFPRMTDGLCRTCHSETRDPDFVFATYLKFATCTQPHDPAANRVPR